MQAYKQLKIVTEVVTAVTNRGGIMMGLELS